jgi:S-(hydroxymethyl)glutathione dehydrogenase / alcohol dehydrogenase
VVGISQTIRQAWDVLKAGGTAIVVGVAPRGVEVTIPGIDLLSEKTLTGSYYGSRDVRTAIGELAQLVVDGRLELADVVSDVIPLEGVQEALDRLRRGEGERSVVLIDEQLAGRSLA